MKNLKKLISTITVIGMVVAAGAVYATANAADTTINTNADLAAFKAQRLEQMKAVLDQRVKEGRLTQEQADAIYKTMKDNQAACDGTGSMRIGSQGCGAGMGFGRGMNR